MYDLSSNSSFNFNFYQEWEYLGDLLAISEIQNFMLTNHVVEQVDAMRIFGNVDRIQQDNLLLHLNWAFDCNQEILMANLELYRTFQKNPWNCKERYYYCQKRDARY